MAAQGDQLSSNDLPFEWGGVVRIERIWEQNDQEKGSSE